MSDSDTTTADPGLLAGTVDLHIHTSPDIFPRLVNAVSAAEEAKQAGMGAIVLKSHSTDTAARAEIARSIVDFPVYGGVVLNYPVGGFNPYAVLETARQGGRIVWMPTLGARHFIASPERSPMLAGAIPPGVDGLVAVDNGVIKDDVLRILDLIAEHDLTLATGHLHPDESAAVVAEAVQRGVQRMIITHPHLPFVGMPVDIARQLADLGAYIEVTDERPIEERAEMINGVGLERCFISTDAGTVAGDKPVPRMGGYLAALLAAGFTEAEVRHLSSAVPGYLLGLSGNERPSLTR